MAAVEAIHVQGVVLDRCSERLVWVGLENGHRVLAHGTRATALKVSNLMAGERVCLEMSPADMSRGRLRFNEERQAK